MYCTLYSRGMTDNDVSMHSIKKEERILLIITINNKNMLTVYG